MKYCNDFAALLDLFVDGELNPEDMIRVQEHLEHCPGCRAYVDAAFAMRAAFPDTDDTEVPEGFTDSVMETVRLHPRRSKRKTPWVKVLTPLAACCAIVILLQSGPMLGSSRNDSSPFAPAGAGMDNAKKSEAMLADAMSPAGEATWDYVKEESSTAYYSDSYTYAAEPESPAAPIFPAESADEVSTRYAMELYLPAECKELLNDVVPVAETGNDIRYELNPSAYEALQAQLKDREIFYDVGVAANPTTNLILVVLVK